jgi:uncharacterized protein
MNMMTQGGIAALAMIGSGTMAEAQIVAAPVIAGTRLDVVARGEVKRVPDVALINAGVVTQSANAGAAMQENASRMSRVLAALKRAGVADKDVTTSSVSLSPQYRYNENQPPVITGYQASNQVNVRFRDIGKSGAILDALVKEGANQINGPSLVIDQPQQAMDEARIAAIKSARARADLYASATGLKVKRIVAISENEAISGGPMPMMARGMMASDASAKTEIMPGEQEIGVTVSVIFELQ